MMLPNDASFGLGFLVGFIVGAAIVTQMWLLGRRR
jgi:hypothetical protein